MNVDNLKKLAEDSMTPIALLVFTLFIPQGIDGSLSARFDRPDSLFVHYLSEGNTPLPLLGLRIKVVHGLTDQFPKLPVHPVIEAVGGWTAAGAVMTEEENDVVFAFDMALTPGENGDWSELVYLVSSDTGFHARIFLRRRTVLIEDPGLALKSALETANKQLLEKLVEWHAKRNAP